MKTKLILAALALVSLASCESPLPPAPRAYAAYPVVPLVRGCRYIAYWGGPNVDWLDSLTGYRWQTSYEAFFRHCGGRHPNALGIAVKGKLPPQYLNQPKKAAPAECAPAGCDATAIAGS